MKKVNCFTALALLSVDPAHAETAAQAAQQESAPAYQPAAENLEARQWFQDAKFGIFIHWGIYSVAERGEWVMNNEKMSVVDYRPLADRFNPTRYDPAAWVSLFKRAGAKYVTITSKHHDGFALWDSEVSDWDVVDATPLGEDLLKPLAERCAEQQMRLFFYHSHLDWTHPDYFPRGMTGGHSGRRETGDFARYLDFMNTQLAELLGGEYGDVAGIWFDGWWDQRDKSAADPKTTHVDWDLPRTYELIHRLQPGCLVGNNHHVAPFAGEDFQMFERDLPGQNTGGHSADAVIGDLPLETCDTINGSWGYHAGDKSVKSTRQLVHYLVKAAGNNANLLLNVGPKPDGSIQPEFVERLEEMGDWLAQHGESIYGTRGGPVSPQPWGISTKKGTTVYLHLLAPPDAGADGWTTLGGTVGFRAREVRELVSDEAVPHRVGGSGELELRLPPDAEAIDIVLTVNQAG